MTKTSSKSEIAYAYDDWSGTYDSNRNSTVKLAARVLRQSDVQLAGHNVVEIGCGTGYNTEWLVERASSVVALDFSEGMLRQAQARVRDARVRFIRHDIQTEWPVAESSVDLVVAMLVLEHVEHLEPVFAEAARTLKRRGEIFVCELHPALQMLGEQARFTSPKTGESQRVTAFLHKIEDYLNAAALAGFELITKSDWHDEVSPDTPPRLLSLHFRASKP